MNIFSLISRFNGESNIFLGYWLQAINCLDNGIYLVNAIPNSL